MIHERSNDGRVTRKAGSSGPITQRLARQRRVHPGDGTQLQYQSEDDFRLTPREASAFAVRPKPSTRRPRKVVVFLTCFAHQPRIPWRLRTVALRQRPDAAGGLPSRRGAAAMCQFRTSARNSISPHGRQIANRAPASGGGVPERRLKIPGVSRDRDQRRPGQTSAGLGVSPGLQRLPPLRRRAANGGGSGWRRRPI
jgi:hypothetical protein